MLRNLSFCSFASFLIVSLILFTNKLDSLRDLTIFIISSTSSFEIINIVIPNPEIFLCIPASVGGATDANPNSIKTVLAYGVSTFFIKGKPVFSNSPRGLPRIPPDSPFLDSHFALVHQNFAL